MTHRIITVACGGPGLKWPHADLSPMVMDNRDNRDSPCEAYETARIINRTNRKNGYGADILIYAHDDLTLIDEYWLTRVRLAFSDSLGNSNVAVVGLGGAMRLGHPDLYKRPYRLQDMARGDYYSNQTDWEVHGKQETGARRVAVVDAFFMAVRADFLERIGGWPVKHISHHCMDTWLCCEAARHGKEVWMVGAECTHHGGGTSTKGLYQNAKWLQGGSTDEDHKAPHRWLYDSYRDVLPIVVNP